MIASEEFLVVTGGPAAGTLIPLAESLEIGRDAPGPGRLGDDGALSSQHARIARQDGALVVENLGSGGGITVNGQAVAGSTKLSVGDTIAVGGSVLEVASIDRGRSQSFVRDTLTLASAAAARAPVPAPAVDVAAFRAEFPVFERVHYLNAGTDGPVARRSLEAAAARIDVVLEQGRSGAAHVHQLESLGAELRAGYARVVGCRPEEIALTRSTADGINLVVWGLDLGAGDEVLTTDEEHPSLLAPLALASARKGVKVREVPFAELASEVGPQTKLVACSHVSWATGQVVDTSALAQSGVPVLLDGAQAAGAVPVDVRAFNCDFYASGGQKWLCGPDGSGFLYVREERFDELSPAWPSYNSLGEPYRAADLVWHPTARRYDMGWLTGSLAAWSLAALDVLASPGLDWVQQRGPDLAERFAELARATGRTVAPRGHSTLVSWASDDPDGEVARLAEQRVVVRGIPGHGLVRASIGAWSSEDEVTRVAGLL